MRFTGRASTDEGQFLPKKLVPDLNDDKQETCHKLCSSAAGVAAVIRSPMVVTAAAANAEVVLVLVRAKMFARVRRAQEETSLPVFGLPAAVRAHVGLMSSADTGSQILAEASVGCSGRYCTVM